jgi:N-methylhydantoinase B
MKPGNGKVDPVTVAVLSSRFEAICEEMGRVLVRTSRSTVFSEARDFAVSLLDKNLRLIAQKEYIPILAGANSISIAHIASAFEGDIQEGDIFIHNDPYDGNTHIGDLNVAKPVFYNGELTFWTIVKGHMADTGNKGVAGNDPTSKTIWQDGILIPATKLYDQGRLNEGVKNLLLRNLKLPDIVWGDILCEIGGVTVAERNLLNMLERYGQDCVYGAIDAILALAEKEVRDIILQIPDGDYFGEHSTDHDAINRDMPVTARVKITVSGDKLTIDLSESDATAAGYVNSSKANTFSACHLTLAYALPGLVKRNQGALVPVEIIAPEGTWINPTFPAPVAKCTTIAAECIGEAILHAFSQAIPGSIAAAHGKMTQYFCSGYNPRTKRRWVDIDFFMTCVPSGGTEGFDGWDLGGPLFCLGGMRLPDLEIIELVKPVHILQHEQEIDTAGVGKYRSGMGHVYKVEYLSDGFDGAALVGAGMQEYVVPTGLFGGKSPGPNTVFLHRKNGKTEKLDVGTFCNFYTGDIMESHFMGAGGFGDPRERDIEKVREDVKNELLSVEAAKNEYGVVIDSNTCEVDYESTKDLRRSLHGVSK